MRSSGTAGSTAGAAVSKPRPPRIKRKRRMRPSVRYTIVFGVFVAIAIIVQFAVHMARTDPRDTRAIAERELQVNTLEPGEQVIRSVSVFKRPAINYFRATHGLLVLTNKRILYLGLEPRDLLAAPDLPPTFEQRDFAIEPQLHVTAGRTFFGLAKAIVIKTPRETLRLGVPAGAWPRADLMIVSIAVRRDKAVAAATTQRQQHAEAEALREVVEESRRKPKFYVVRRGDALVSIATIWNTTPEKLREWNKLPDNRIRIGQRIMVRPQL